MLSILYYLWCVPVITVFFLLSVIALIVCYPFDRGRRVVHELSRALCMVFWRTPPTWRRDVSGLENVEKGKPYVIVLNHNSMVDIISLYFVPLNFRWVSKREVFRIPFIGGLLVLHGDIAIERGRGAESMRKVIRDGRTWLSRGVSVAMFPEGTRSKDGEMHRFIPILAKQAGFRRIGEKVVEHHARKYGCSKFGLERTVKGYLDLITVLFMTHFGRSPMYFFGSLGTLMFLIGGGTTVWIIAAKIWKQVHGLSLRPVTDQPLFYLAILAVILGVQLFLAGFLGELINRSSSDRNKYLIDKTL